MAEAELAGSDQPRVELPGSEGTGTPSLSGTTRPQGGGSEAAGVETPSYVGSGGAVASNPLAVADQPVVSLGKLAQYLTNPVLGMNIGAPCPWASVERVRQLPSLRADEVAVGELAERFAASVSRTIGDAETVIVFFSGGLDSLAVLVEVDRQCSRQGRRLVPLVWDLTDQLGVSAAATARSQLQAINADLEPVVIPYEWGGLPEPAWSSHGPRTDCHGRLRRRTDETVSTWPHSVMLTGQGGDEVLGAWNFGTRALLSSRRFGDLRHYLAAFARYETTVEVAGELASLVSRACRIPWSFRAYLAFGWSDLLAPDPGEVIMERFAPAINTAHVRWLEWRYGVFREGPQSWESAMLFDQIYPFAHDAHPSDAPVPNRSPFLDPEFVTYMANLSWTDRFDAQREDPYHWYKALQLRLLPAALHELLPRYKSHYGEAYRRYLEDLWPQPPLALHDLGVMHPIRYADLRRRHPYLPLAVRNVELWLRGALERGFAVAD